MLEKVSHFEARVNGDNAEGEVSVRSEAESGLLDHGLELLLSRELADALH